MRNFIGFGQVAYIGQAFVRSIKLAGISGQCSPFFFPWLIYGASTSVPNINVLVSLENPVCKALDQIRSVYIDNLNSSIPVYVYFPDTGTTIVAKPNSEGWYQAFTNAKVFWVIGIGFLTGDIPQTLVTVSNLALPPLVNTELDQSVNLWKASPLISRGLTPYNQNLGIPALGDQSIAYNSTAGGVGILNNNLWGTPLASGFVYVTGVYWTAKGIAVAGAGNLVVQVESTGVAGTLWQASYFTPNSASGNSPENADVLLNLGGQMSLKLDATQTWRLRATNWSSNPVQLSLTTNYTINPT